MAGVSSVIESLLPLARKSPEVLTAEKRAAEAAPLVKPMAKTYSAADIPEGRAYPGLTTAETADMVNQVGAYRQLNGLTPNDRLGIPLFRRDDPYKNARDIYTTLKKTNENAWWGKSTGDNYYDGLLSNDELRQSKEASVDVIMMSPNEYISEAQTLSPDVRIGEGAAPQRTRVQPPVPQVGARRSIIQDAGFDQASTGQMPQGNDGLIRDAGTNSLASSVHHNEEMQHNLSMIAERWPNALPDGREFNVPHLLDTPASQWTGANRQQAFASLTAAEHSGQIPSSEIGYRARAVDELPPSEVPPHLRTDRMIQPRAGESVSMAHNRMLADDLNWYTTHQDEVWNADQYGRAQDLIDTHANWTPADYDRANTLLEIARRNYQSNPFQGATVSGGGQTRNINSADELYSNTNRPLTAQEKRDQRRYNPNVDEVKNFARNMINQHNGTDLPVLDYNGNTSDGILRAYAAEQLGIRKIPVVVVRSNRTVYPDIHRNPSGDYRVDLMDREGHSVGRITSYFDKESQSVQVGMSDLQPKYRGRGVGLDMYKALINRVMDDGYQFQSDSSLSQYSYRIYKSLEKQGYKVRMAPDAKGDEVGGFRANGPVFTIIGRPEK